MTPLFRKEALEFQRERLYGSVLLSTSRGASLLTLAVALLAAALCIFFAQFGFTRKEVALGMVVPRSGLVRVRATQPGVITRLFITEGDKVRAGDPLLAVSSDEQTEGLISARVAIQKALRARIARFQQELEAQQRQARQQIEAAHDRLSLLDSEHKQLERQIATQTQRVEIEEVTVARYRELLKQNYVSDAQLNAKTADLLDQRAKLSELQRARAALASTIRAVQSEKSQLPLRAARDSSEIERSMEEMRQSLAENEARREVLIKAPYAATVSALTAAAGQNVLAGQEVLTLAAENDGLEVELYVPSRAIGFVKAGTPISIRVAAFPYQKFGQLNGRVRQISGAAIVPGDSTLPYGKDVLSEPVYRLRATLSQPSFDTAQGSLMLKPGMRIEASLLLEHRKLYEWAFGPLFSLRRSLD